MVELRQHVGQELFKKTKTAQRWDEVICDGLIIGMSFRFEGKIHWHYPKKMIPNAVIRDAVRLCQRRNENRE